MLEVENVDALITEALELAREKLGREHADDAELIAKQVLKVDVTNQRAWQLLGLAKYANKNYDEAIEICNKLIACDPDNPEHRNNIALAYSSKYEFDMAIFHMKHAINLSPKTSHYHSNLGLLFRQTGDLDGSVECFKSAIGIDPNNAYAWINLGSVYGRMKRIDDAIQCLNQGSILDPSNKHAKVNLAYAHLLKKDWETGWREYENRIDSFKQLEYFKKIFDPAKRWCGDQDISHKRILVHCEQGAGDTLQFCRFLPLLNNKGCSVLFQVPKELLSLAQHNTHLVRNVDLKFENEQYDYFCSLMSLPYLLKLKKLEPVNRYLYPTQPVNFGKYGSYYKIGISWAGNPQHPNDPERSCRLEYFKSLQSPQIKLFSLQKDTRKRRYAHSNKLIDLAENCDDMALVDMSPHMTDFMTTAMIIEGLDLIITVDTAVLHLAGALGKETWGLIPYNPDWRWGLEGETTEWYPSVRLFRQPRPGDWEGVFSQVQQELQKRVSA